MLTHRTNEITASVQYLSLAIAFVNAWQQRQSQHTKPSTSVLLTQHPLTLTPGSCSLNLLSLYCSFSPDQFKGTTPLLCVTNVIKQHE